LARISRNFRLVGIQTNNKIMFKNDIKKEFGGIILNTGCSQKCLFCRGPKPRIRGMELRKQEIEIYRNILYFKKIGINKIEISGSDPIEYNKIIELIRYLKEEGFEFVQLSTHGTRLANPSFLNKLISSGLDKLRIPIYGSNTKIHDSVTQTPGSFQHLVKGFKLLRKKNNSIDIQMSCLIVDQNKNDLVNIADFVTNELSVEDFYFSIPCINEGDLSFYIPLKNLNPYVKKLYEYVLRTNDRIKFFEIPFCVFGKLDTKHINNTILPPNLGKYNQPPPPVRTSIPDIPSYRIKKKVTMCKKCKAFNYCDGFFVNDIERFGIGNLKPVIK